MPSRTKSGMRSSTPCAPSCGKASTRRRPPFTKPSPTAWRCSSASSIRRPAWPSCRAVGSCATANFLEGLAEDVAEGVRLEHGANDPQSLPRRALNTLQWEIPVNLPPAGPPATLTAEAHSFSRVFTGCFYDTVCNIFASQPNQDEQGLLTAATTAGRLLIAGAAAAPESARFFQAVGRAMILDDEVASGGASSRGDSRRLRRSQHRDRKHGDARADVTPGRIGADGGPGRRHGGPSGRRPPRSAGAHRRAAWPAERDGPPDRRPGRHQGGSSARRLAGEAHAATQGCRRARRPSPSWSDPAPPAPSSSGTCPMPAPRSTRSITSSGRCWSTAPSASRRPSAPRRKAATPESQTLPTHTLQTRGGKTALKRIRFSCGCSSR